MAESKPRLRLKHLKIENFRGIDSLALDFTDPNGEPLDLVVFGGDNGTGKTTILEAIFLLSGRPLGSDKPEVQIRFGASDFLLRGEFEANPQEEKKAGNPLERIQKMWRLFHGDIHELDVIPVDSNPGSGD